jgi:hypothetical protein
MTIGASGIEHALGCESGTRMARMTLFAQKRFPQFKQVVVDRTMRGMAGGAFFGDVAMFEEKRPGFFGMAAAAGLFLGHLI